MAFLVVLSLCYFASGATHIVGGEIYYTHLGNYNYRITLKIFRDCGPTNTNGTGFDVAAKVSVYSNGNNALQTIIDMPFGSASVNFVPVQLENPCFVLPPDVCVQQAIYNYEIFLPPNANGYTLTHQRCCRNPSIVNLNSPAVQGATFTTTIPGTNLVGNDNNSCARFTHLPPVALCQNAEFYFDHSATDPDGDSLSYQLCSPMLGGTPDAPAPNQPTSPPYTSVSWGNGFNPGYPIASNPAFVIDPITGQMSGTATQLGQFVIGVCVSEYRDGVLINTTNRDFQFNVTICDPNIMASGPADFEFCVGESVQFENNSINGTFFHWDFGVPGITTDTSSLETPSFTYTSSGVYQVMLVANPGWPCADTAYSTVTSLSLISPNIIVEGYSCINGEDYYSFASTSNASTLAVYNWDFGAGSVPQFSSLMNPGNVKMNPEAPSMTASLQIIDDGGCPETDQEIIENPPNVVAAIVPQEAFCSGYFYQFQSVPTPAQNYKWDFGIPGDADVSGLPNPGFLFPDTGHYRITLIVNAPFTCPDTTTTNFEIYGNLNPFFAEQDPMCFDIHSFDFQASGASTNSAIFHWDFGENAVIQTSALPNPQNITYTEPGHYDVSLTISENGCDRTYIDEVWVPDNMIAEFEIGNQEGCPELSAQFVAAVQADSPLTYLWDLGDGTTKGVASFTHIYSNSGYYDITITVQTTTGCIESLTRHFPQAVFVYPVPVARFVIDPQRLNILEPFIEVRDSSIGATTCYYTLSDGSIYNEFNFHHAWQQAGFQTVTQYVMNEYGCKDEISGQVAIDGFYFYAPNSFTPDNDGLNDYWLPVMTGVQDYHIQIFNRWGEKVFDSTDTTQPWLGNFHEGEHYVQNGVYLYLVQFNDLLNYPRQFQGHISVVR